MFLNSTGRRITPEAAWAWDFLSQRRWSKHMEDRSRSRVPPAEAPDSHFLSPPRRTPDGLSNLFGVAPGGYHRAQIPSKKEHDETQHDISVRHSSFGGGRSKRADVRQARSPVPSRSSQGRCI